MKYQKKREINEKKNGLSNFIFHHNPHPIVRIKLKLTSKIYKILNVINIYHNTHIYLIFIINNYRSSVLIIAPIRTVFI